MVLVEIDGDLHDIADVDASETGFYRIVDLAAEKTRLDPSWATYQATM